MPLHGRRFAGGSATQTPVPGAGHSGGGPPTIPPGQAKKGVIEVAQETVLNAITSSAKARVILYETQAAADTDVASERKIGTPPSHNQGILAEFVHSTGQTITTNPYTVLKNGDTPRNKNIYYSVTNLETVDTAVDLTLDHTPIA